MEMVQSQIARKHANEVARKERFEFGKNWNRFLSVLDDDRILQAENSLKAKLKIDNLIGKSFLDIGSGSGLFSLAARRLGARVHSFDYDTNSVACTSELRRRYFPDDCDWKIEQGSALDVDYIKTVGKFDIVYSWGVLHHTGQMWQALENACIPIAASGKLFVALYNDTGSQSARWKWLKRTYNALPSFLRIPFTLLVSAPEEIKLILKALVRLRPAEYVRMWTGYGRRRGMSRWFDIVDWVGGYPYEVAKPEDIFAFYSSRGFILINLKCGGVGLGCNEFVFQQTEPAKPCA